MTFRPFIIFLLGISLVPAMAQTSASPTVKAASQKSGTPYSLNVTTTVVSLDVVVTDHNGNPVDNLKQDDFEIFESKTPQDIRSFDPPETHYFPASLAINSTAQLDQRAPNAAVSIIVLDEANTKFEDQAFARYSIQRYLKTQPEHLTQPTELVAIDLTHFMMLRDYTTSKQAILDALNHHLEAYPWQLGGSWAREQFIQSFLALQQVAKAVAGHPGHKNMIWIGHGFPTLDMSAMDPIDVDKLQAAIDDTANKLRDSRITLYTIDPAGVTVDDGGVNMDGDPIDTDPFGSSVDFDAMAKATGGLALFGRNDVDHLIGQSVRDGSHFYTLTYRPSANASADKFRAIHVVMKIPGLTATTREGYYVKPTDAPPVVQTAPEEVAEAGGDLMAASENQMVYDGLPINVSEDSSNRQKFIVHVPAPGLDWQQTNSGAPSTRLYLLVATFDRKGRLIHRDAKIINATNLRVHDRGAQPAINLAIELDLAKAARIRFVVRNGATGRIGAQNVSCSKGRCTVGM